MTTNNLTEQWKKGELEEYKKYYCKTKWFEDIFQARCYNKGTGGEWWALENEKYRYNSIFHAKDIEVLTPVPSYEKYKCLETGIILANSLIKNTEEENQKLKELLKECKEVIYDLVDDEPCRLDHHGYCQNHSWMSSDLCPNERGKSILTKINEVLK